MIRRGQQALSAAAAGACLALCACGSGSAPAANGSSGSAPSGAGSPTASAGTTIRGTSKFCRKAGSFMGKIPPAPTGHVSVAAARANLTTVLQTTVRGFTELRAESPHALRRPLKKISRRLPRGREGRPFGDQHLAAQCGDGQAQRSRSPPTSGTC